MKSISNYGLRLWLALLIAPLHAEIIPFAIDVELAGRALELEGLLADDDPDYWALNGDELLQALQPLLSPAKLTEISPLMSERMISADELNGLGWPTHYDEDTLQLTVTIPIADRKRQQLNFGYTNPGVPDGFYKAQPHNFSGVVNAYLTHSHNLSDTEQFGDTLALRTGVAWGPVTLEDGHSYFYLKDGSNNGWQRDRTRLMGDLPNDTGFIQFGDIRTETDIQRQIDDDLFGLSYSYQPEYIRTYRRSNSLPFTLESAARVEIIINGEPYRTVRLAPGQYNLNDLPTTGGVNEVEVRYQDQSGLLVQHFFNVVDHPNLLQQGDIETQWVLGYRQEYDQSGVKEILDDEPVASAVFSYGLTPNWTLSPIVDWSQDNRYLGLLHYFALGDNFLSIDTNWRKQQQQELYQGAVALFVPHWPIKWLRYSNIRYELSDSNQDDSDLLHRATISTGIDIGLPNSYFSFNYNVDWQSSTVNSQRASINSNFTLPNNINAGLNFSWQEQQGRYEQNVTLSFSIPLGVAGKNLYARSRYDSQRSQLESELNLSHYDPHKDWRASVNFIDDKYESADLFYRQKLDNLNYRARLTSRNEDSDAPQRTAELGLESGIAWAGSSWALTSPIESSFTIVSLSEQMEHYALQQGDYGRLSLIRAEDGGSNSAVISIDNRGSRAFRLDSDVLEFDEELNYSDFVVYGGLRRGSSINLDLLKGYFVSGILIDKYRHPLVDKVGELVSPDNDNSYPFYTGLNGEFELDMIPEGSYHIEMYEQLGRSNSITVKVTNSDQVLIELGEITIEQ
ncbi:fimbria/pilus outer membrane usher protein [Ferrimonas lipolytica]|uniref:Outer membrane usher protein FimD/PapC n=1 Tax=Ferrimonas lipolytica TaxID=2724191 RepID=A0A6H1U8W0_9GAMM|nr:fimbria/pilus outer membrane usher protein [Ferrimonas lipolytica]QIZ75464.1 hypothetical protein HER31_00210 [Ferrimonas lipolytica]